ncbi:MAG: hypothetical protein ACTHYM_10050, partial [Actinomycetaceae bacterium]
MPPPASPASPPGEDRPEDGPHSSPLPCRALAATGHAPTRALTATTRALTGIGLTTRADRFLVAAVAAWLL